MWFEGQEERPTRVFICFELRLGPMNPRVVRRIRGRRNCIGEENCMEI